MLALSYPRPLWVSISLIYTALGMLSSFTAFSVYSAGFGSSPSLLFLSLVALACSVLSFFSLWQLKLWGLMFFILSSLAGNAGLVALGLMPNLSLIIDLALGIQIWKARDALTGPLQPSMDELKEFINELLETKEVQK